MADASGNVGLEGFGFPKTLGVSRVSDNSRAILISFERPLTDDQMRLLHEEIRLLEHEVLALEIRGQKH